MKRIRREGGMYNGEVVLCRVRLLVTGRKGGNKWVGIGEG